MKEIMMIIMIKEILVNLKCSTQKNGAKYCEFISQFNLYNK